MQAIARRGDGRVINVSPLWTLQCLSSGPDQMLRQPALTAKRTMTRAGDVNDALDREAAIRERPPRVKSAFESELPCRLRVCVRPVRAAIWPLAQIGVRLPKLPFYLRAERAPFGTGYLRVSVRPTVHTLLRLGLSEAALCR